VQPVRRSSYKGLSPAPEGFTRLLAEDDFISSGWTILTWPHGFAIWICCFSPSPAPNSSWQSIAKTNGFVRSIVANALRIDLFQSLKKRLRRQNPSQWTSSARDGQYSHGHMVLQYGSVVSALLLLLTAKTNGFVRSIVANALRIDLFQSLKKRLRRQNHSPGWTILTWPHGFAIWICCFSPSPAPNSSWQFGQRGLDLPIQPVQPVRRSSYKGLSPAPEGFTRLLAEDEPVAPAE
jgi:hypothetical protein